MLVLDNVAYTVVDPITALGKLFVDVVRRTAWKKLNGIGVSMLKNEEGLYSFLYDGKSIAADLTKKQAEEFLKEIFTKSKGKTDDVVKKYLDDIKRIFTEITEDVLKHANDGEFSLPANPKRSTLPGKMKVGGHGQDNLVFLDEIGRNYKIEHTYENGVRIGSVEGHDKKIKKLVEGRNNTGQSWFPKDWNSAKIEEAYKYVVRNNLDAFKQLQDGPPPLFDVYDGVRVGVLKTNGKPATIFPDNAMQPRKSIKELEINPF